jgi:uncharacterized damage-inducible protein DinB
MIMKKTFGLLLAFAATTVFAQQSTSQSKNPVMDALRQSMQRAQKNIPAAAEEMPADKFSYKPTDKQMTFGKLAAHIVEGNEYFCSRLGDREEPKQGAEPKETDSKEKLVAAIGKSFDYCNSTLANIDDSKLADPVKIFGGRTVTKAAVVLMLAGSWSDHYGMEAQYLRLNGLTPPTAKEKD